MLHNDRSWGNAITVANVPNPQAHQIAGPQFAVQPKVKKRKLPCALTKLKSYPDASDVFEFQWGLLPDDLSLVPWNLDRRSSFSVHDALLKLRGELL